MKTPNLSWRPTTAQVTTTAVAIVCLLFGFWIGWQHRSNIDPNSVTPSVPKNMRTHAVHVIAPATVPTHTASTTTTGASSTPATPAAPLPPRGSTKIAVFNAGGTPGVAVQLAVSIVELGYPTPATGNITLPANQLPTSTVPAGSHPTTTGTSTATSATSATTTSTPPSTTSTAPTPPPQGIYYRVGELDVADRLASDLGITEVAALPTTGPLVTAAPAAQLIVVVGSG
jgi:hypothetical protein